MSIGILRRGLTAVIVLSAISVTSCAVGTERLPLPAPSVGPHSYTVTATFGNALNLPAKAEVKVNGAGVGKVEGMRARDYAAVVTMRIRSEVTLPVGTAAELRSATPLGDVFVALVPPAAGLPGAPVLRDGDSIPESSTSAAATIEDVLSRAALLVNGGVMRDLTKVVNGLGAEFEGRGDRLGDLIAETTTLVQTLSRRSEQIRAAVRDTGALAETVAAQQSTVNDAVAAAGPALAVVGESTQSIADLAARFAGIAGQLEKFPSVNGTGDRSIIADLNNLAAGLNAAAENPDANLDNLNKGIATVGGKVASSTAASPAGVDIYQLALGVVPDPNFPGNPESKIPDRADWANLVGSLAYTLQRLHDRVIGPGR